MNRAQASAPGDGSVEHFVWCGGCSCSRGGKGSGSSCCCLDTGESLKSCCPGTFTVRWHKEECESRTGCVCTPVMESLPVVQPWMWLNAGDTEVLQGRV